MIELIQNAHDALFDIEKRKADKDTPEDKGRIEVVIANEPPFGALYLANDGSPFTESNFISLSRFGQSDKDPEKHIGNKGIGFRSVLEITRVPEIFSRKEKKSTSFNGFTFRFNPGIIQSFEKPIQALLNGNEVRMESYWRATEGRLLEIAALLEQRGIPVILLAFPMENQLRGHDLNVRYAVHLQRIWEATGMPFVDVEPAFRQALDDGSPCYSQVSASGGLLAGVCGVGGRGRRGGR